VFVLDASVTMSWCYENENTEAGRSLLRRLREQRGIVPPIWRYEVANALLAGERRCRLEPERLARFLELVESLDLEVERDATPRPGNEMMLGRRYGISAYDASYLQVAMSRSVALATFDRRLCSAAESAGVPLLTK
jgi:predicted nucleic acid-binding protein